jgi:hypothetical protein
MHCVRIPSSIPFFRYVTRFLWYTMKKSFLFLFDHVKIKINHTNLIQ